MGKTILFADDENDRRFMAEKVLREAGYEMLSARDGTEACKGVKGSNSILSFRM